MTPHVSVSRVARTARLFAVLAVLAPSALAQFTQPSPPVGGGGPLPRRLMPVGDSITQGGQTFASWRYALWLSLPAQPEVDFVGTRNTVHNGDTPTNPNPSNYPLYATDFDRDHEAWWGKRTDQVEPVILAAAWAERPDIVLLHLGTNDIGQGYGVANATTYLPRILHHVRAACPATTFLLAQLIPIGGTGSYSQHAHLIPVLNADIASIAAAENTAASPVVLVDQYSSFSLTSHMRLGGVHPNLAGESHMASVWLATLVDHLGLPNPPQQVAAAVLDPSFEALGLADGQSVEHPSDTPWRFGWTPSTSKGLWNPDANAYTGAAGSGTPLGADGDEVAYLHDTGNASELVVLYQTLATTCKVGKTYTLTVAVGNRLSGNGTTFGGYRIELLGGNEVLAGVSDAIVPFPGEFADATLSFTANSLPLAAVGQALTVRLRMTEGAADSATDFDHVRLSVN